jgi:hypothetical protein
MDSLTPTGSPPRESEDRDAQAAPATKAAAPVTKAAAPASKRAPAHSRRRRPTAGTEAAPDATATSSPVPTSLTDAAEALTGILTTTEGPAETAGPDAATADPGEPVSVPLPPDNRWPPSTSPDNGPSMFGEPAAALADPSTETPDLGSPGPGDTFLAPESIDGTTDEPTVAPVTKDGRQGRRARRAAKKKDRGPRTGRPGSRRRLALRIVLAGVFGGVVGLGTIAALAGGPKVYRSQATLLIDDPRGIDRSGDALLIDKLAQLRSKYAGLIKTDPMAGPVAKATSLPEDTVISSMFATVDTSSLLMFVGADYSTPDGAKAIAAAGAQAVIDYVKNEQTSLNIPANTQFYFQDVLPAQLGVKIKPKNSNAVEGGAAVGLLVFGLWYGGAMLIAAARHGS